MGKSQSIARKVEEPEDTSHVEDVTNVVEIVGSESDLDAAVHDIRVLKLDIAANMHQLGLKIAHVHESKLWTARQDGGQNKWKTFAQFCEVELGMTWRHAARLMGVAREYTDDQLREVGATKLYLMLEVPKEHRAPLEDKAKKGASAREIREEVRRIRQEKNVQQSSRTTKATEVSRNKASDSRILKARAVANLALNREVEGKVTLRMPDKPNAVPLYMKPAKSEFDWDDLTPAKTIRDYPIGRMVLDQGVTIYFSIKENAEGHLVATVTPFRETT